MANLYADENFPLPVVEALRDLGHDVLTAHDAGRANSSVSDPVVLADATALDRAVLTLNRQDFIALHRKSDAHAGIIAYTADLDFAGQAKRIDEAISANPALERQLLRVNRPSA